MMSSFFKAMRAYVSADKKRFNLGGFDLDLTYITDRIIAMSFPADGVESTYRNDIAEVSRLLSLNHKNHFMIFNLSERTYDDKRFFDGRVQSWCGFPDHHAPPLLLLLRIVQEIHNFLMANSQNVVVVHCLAGKGRTGTVIAAYLIFSGLFDNADAAMNYFAVQRSVNNWGITGPSQKKYIQYFAELWKKKEKPSQDPILIKSLVMTRVPKLSLGPLKTGINPSVYIYDFTYYPRQNLIWTNKINSQKADKQFLSSQQNIVFPVEKLVRGDILVVMEHSALVSSEKVARFAFNTGMIPSDATKLVFSKSDIDEACSDARFPNDFAFEIYFERVPLQSLDKEVREEIAPAAVLEEETTLLNSLFNTTPPRGGAACFWADKNLKEKLMKAQGTALYIRGTAVEKGGFLVKQGHKVKNWKRRWFVLHADTLSYYKSPKEIKPLGIIKVDEVFSVSDEDKEIDGLHNLFWVRTHWTNYLLSAENERDKEEWIEAIKLATKLRDQMKSEREGLIGTLLITVLEAESLPKLNITKASVDPYACVLLDHQRYKTDTVLNNNCPIFPHQEFVFEVDDPSKELTIQLWDYNTILSDELIGEVTINLDLIVRPNVPNAITEWWMLWRRTAFTERPAGKVRIGINFIPKHCPLLQKSGATSPSTSRSTSCTVVPSVSNTVPSSATQTPSPPPQSNTPKDPSFNSKNSVTRDAVRSTSHSQNTVVDGSQANFPMASHRPKLVPFSSQALSLGKECDNNASTVSPSPIKIAFERNNKDINTIPLQNDSLSLFPDTSNTASSLLASGS
jgi:protein-tyrosine phosphatase